MKAHDLFAVPADAEVLERQARAQRAYYIAVTVLCVLILAAWVVPSLGALLPSWWSLAKANTAVAILLLVGSMALTEWSESVGMRMASRLLAALAIIPAATALYAHISGSSSFVETLLAADASAELPGAMSVPAAVLIIATAIAMLFDGMREEVDVLVADVMALIASGSLLVAFTGFVLRVSGIYPMSFADSVSPLMLLAAAMLVAALIGRRSRFGIFSAVVAGGLAGRIVRAARLFVFVFPLTIMFLGEWSIVRGWLSTALARSITAAVFVIVPMLFMIVVSARVGHLEEELSQRSLTDPLTGLLNRRGLHLLGEQELRLSRRRGKALSVVILYLNKWRSANDEAGFEVGTAMLTDAAELLRHVFRESDLIGRVGADEFAVVMEGTDTDTDVALRRLADAADRREAEEKREYPTSFLVGAATSPVGDRSSFYDVMERANTLLWERRRSLRSGQPPRE